MTAPHGYDGTLWAELKIDGSKAPEELRRALVGTGNGAAGGGGGSRGGARVLGEDIGKEIDKGLTSEVNRRATPIGLNLASRIEKSIVARPIKLAIADTEHEIDRIAETVTRRLGQSVSRGFIQNFSKGFTGILTQISGSLGNVSGGSKLAVVLIPLIGSLVALIIAAVHGLEALIGLLYAIPDILFAIGLQAGVLFLVFHGLTQSIAAAFSAKNAQELNAALKAMNPEVAKFVKSLLPLRDLFKYLTWVAQTQFFKTFGTTLGDTIGKLGPLLAVAVNGISISLGNLFKTFFGFFGSPLFQEFFLKISIATQKWLDGFSNGLLVLLTGFHNFAISVLDSGFIDMFGKKFNNFVASIGRWFDNLANDKKFQDWLNSIFETIDNHLLPALGSIWNVLKSLAKAMDVHGFGDTLLDLVTVTFQTMADFFNSDVGRNGLDLIAATLAVLLVLTGQLIIQFVNIFGIIATGAIWAADGIAAFYEWVSKLIDKIRGIGPSAHDAMSEIGDKFTAIGDFIMRIGENIKNYFFSIPTIIWNFLKGIPDMLKAIISNFFSPENFVQIGRNIIEGIKTGIQNAKAGFKSVMAGAIKEAVTDQTPHSPAKTGPLSGKGDPMIAGQNIVNRLASGIEMTAPALSTASSNAMSNVFMPGSISVGFHGALPTQQQAFNTGNAVGNGITSQLQATSLKVRTL